MELDIQIPIVPAKQKQRRLDLASLTQPSVRSAFCGAFVEGLAEGWQGAQVDAMADSVKQAMLRAATQMPTASATAHRPWISAHTLDLIRCRNDARNSGSRGRETELNKDVKRSAKVDRNVWLSGLLESGDWNAVQRLRKPRLPKQGRLRNLRGELVESEMRAQTLGEYLEQVQWSIHFADAAPADTELYRDGLAIADDVFTTSELQRVLVHLQAGKASGEDGIPPDFWKALLIDSVVLDAILHLCNQCLIQKVVPDEWRHASVTTIFKKGDTSLPSNYRPISLLAVGYKVLASLVLRRLQQGGSEHRISKSQYGFRPGRGTSDALFLIRRMIEATIDDTDASLYVVLLDWSKAFDRIKHDCLIKALHRFGVRGAMLDLIGAIYKDRTFSVNVGNESSATFQQAAGIAQGCPLSPYLFIIVMTVALQDARRMSQLEETQDLIVTPDLVYADDTMLLGSSAQTVQKYLDNVIAVGRTYGLELNLQKTVLLRVRATDDVFGSDGVPLTVKNEALYLGGQISCAGEATAEISRRLGEGRRSFHILAAVWKHANISRQRKLQIFGHVLYQRCYTDLNHCGCLKISCVSWMPFTAAVCARSQEFCLHLFPESPTKRSSSEWMPHLCL